MSRTPTSEVLKTCVPFEEFEVAMPGNALEFVGPPAGFACIGAEGPMIRLLLYVRAGTCECDTKKRSENGC